MASNHAGAPAYDAPAAPWESSLLAARQVAQRTCNTDAQFVIANDDCMPRYRPGLKSPDLDLKPQIRSANKGCGALMSDGAGPAAFQASWQCGGRAAGLNGLHTV